MSTVKENPMNYTTSKPERAKKVHKLYYIIGTPTVQNFKALLRINSVDNCLVTMEDVKISEMILGQYLSSTKSKNTRTKPKPVLRDEFEFPK